MSIVDLKKRIILGILEEDIDLTRFRDELIIDDDILYKFLSMTTPREEWILRMRFGLGAENEHAVKDIAPMLRLSESSIRRHQARALKKLASHPWREILKKYISILSDGTDKCYLGIEDVRSVIETTKNLTVALIAYLKSHIDSLNELRWEVFEHLVGEFFASLGFEDVRLVGRSYRTSADIYAAKSLSNIGTLVRYFIEVKRWKNKVGVNIIDQVYGAMLNERPTFGWNAAIIVSSSGFKDFEKYNRRELSLKGVELKDRNDLLNWLEGYKPNKNGLWLPEPSFHEPLVL